ncbi:MAG: hypothetical protein RMJ51_03100 [Candidatus Calescibacterium sp.]|nr:hypothetical protein [Candidatus Calescibacterium sp.]MDW8195213.1 hypothetical protein [Candidatus Calescibacterium sp.]
MFGYAKNKRHNVFFAFPDNVNVNTIRSQYFNNQPEVLSNNPNGGWNTNRPGSIASSPVNVPGAFYIIREALARSHSIITSITGFSFYYIGLGQEVGEVYKMAFLQEYQYLAKYLE